MKIYLTGGAVRDMVMGIVPKDRDYVVVGATAEDMLAQGFQQVGAGFPVFLHPETGDEYALARQERKTGVGYNGFETRFDPTITLEDDLYRRDLTINAMAVDITDDTYKLIDPHGGQHDIAQRVLRHTSVAFAEDPVRVLRTARFAARYGFTVANDTLELMRQVAPELAYVPRERIWAEIEKGLTEALPYRMFRVLEQCGALDVDCMRPFAHSQVLPLLAVVESGTPMYVRVALVAAGMSKQEMADCKIPSDMQRVPLAASKHSVQLRLFDRSCAEEQVTVLDQMRAFSDPTLVHQTVEYLRFVFGPKVATSLDGVLTRAKSVDAAAVAASVADKSQIRQTIINHRVQAVKNQIYAS
jgi:hypothetical protein